MTTTDLDIRCTFPGCGGALPAPATHRVVSQDPRNRPHDWHPSPGPDPAVVPCLAQFEAGCRHVRHCMVHCDRWRYRQPEFCAAHADEVAQRRYRKALPGEAT